MNLDRNIETILKQDEDSPIDSKTPHISVKDYLRYQPFSDHVSYDDIGDELSAASFQPLLPTWKQYLMQKRQSNALAID